jgi:two-component system NarL family sensor kinase
MINDSKYDISFLIFASIFLFGILVFFLFTLFNQYRKRQRKNFLEQQELKSAFQQTLLQAQLEIQEQTFSNISQEIHDNVGQVLSLVKVQVNILNERDAIDKNMLNEIKENISRVMTDLRSMAKGLNSDRLKSLSIQQSVKEETERIGRHGFVNAIVTSTGEEYELPEQKKLILFRIIQEGLQNIIKHADATDVQIVFLWLATALEVTITDNGKGFESGSTPQSHSGMGLNNMQTRATLTGGSCIIQSLPNAGTTIKISIPYA